MRPRDLKRVLKESDVGSTNVVAREDFAEPLVEEQLPTLDRFMYIDLEGHILVVSAVKVSRDLTQKVADRRQADPLTQGRGQAR